MTKAGVSSCRSEVTSLLRSWGEAGLTKGEWRRFEDEEHLEADEIAHNVLRARRRQQTISLEPQASGAPESFQRWLWALSLLHADDAERDEHLQAFRRNQLGGLLLKLDQVCDWVDQKVAETPTDDVRGYVMVPIREGEFDPGDLHVNLQAGPRQVVSFDWPFMLEFPQGTWIGRRPTRPGSLLDELRIVSEHVSRNRPWQVAQATAFILTGAVPIAQVLRSSATRGTHDPIVSITGDPRTPVELVTGAWLRLRRETVGVRNRLPVGRGLGATILELENPGISDGQLMRLWNEAHPDEAFADLRALRQARRDTLRCFGAVPS